MRGLSLNADGGLDHAGIGDQDVLLSGSQYGIAQVDFAHLTSGA